jgi:nitrite reductase (NADH) small subunit
MVRHHIGRTERFPKGRGVDVQADGLAVTVFNLDGEFYAVSSRCPHKGAPFSLIGQEKEPNEQFSGRESYRGEIDWGAKMITCPWHSLSFDLETGECPATHYRVRSFEIDVEGEDVYLKV